MLQVDITVAFLYLKRACKKDGESMFTKACTDRIRDSGFKVKESKFRFDIRKTFFVMRVEQVAQWCVYTFSGSIQNQVGHGFEQSSQVKDCLAHGRRLD